MAPIGMDLCHAVIVDLVEKCARAQLKYQI